LNSLIFFAYAAPIALVMAAVVGGLQPGLRPRWTLLAGRIATLAALLVAVSGLVWVVWQGPATSPLIGSGGAGLAVRLDMLSAIMLVLVTFIGVVVVQFSRNYMDGDARQGAFIGALCLTTASVAMLVLSGNLVQFVLAWIATSLSLHRLLVFYPERPGAVLAARKKFITARLGDACLVAAAMLLVGAFGSLDIATLLDRARLAQAAGLVPSEAPYAAALLVVAALLKSAQFPTHGWLLDVMETPTPVSALLHAGIINAGGFLIIRFADVVLLSSASMHVLGLIGGLTALVGAVVMLTQTSVKVALAWSTTAQMGFMMLQCGLGAFPIAVLHIVAHSLYKAHAFLSSGSAVEVARALPAPVGDRAPAAWRVTGNLVLALVTVVLVGILLGVSPSHDPAILAFGAIFVLGLSQFSFFALSSGKGVAGRPWMFVRTAATTAALAGLYFALQHAAAAILRDVLPSPLPPDGLAVAIMLLAVVSFAAITLLQLIGPRADSSAWQRAYVHLANGLYANALFNRFAGAMKPQSGTTPAKENA
jgi:NAD(P)H-quinone oxidoreductase subunit 5